MHCAYLEHTFTDVLLSSESSVRSGVEVETLGSIGMLKYQVGIAVS